MKNMKNIKCMKVYIHMNIMKSIITMENVKILRKRHQSVIDNGKQKTVTIPSKFAPESEEVEVIIGETSKGNKVMIVKLD